ncbi:MAG: 16S rRNA (adenine(1518)-N(6)/adenine(1519)-N(6))-dimethyltransferase RsmA [Balneolaceae bacterium]
MVKSFKTKKSLGQHILRDRNIIRKITDSIPAKYSDLIIEIGPGTGALTEELVQNFENITVIEIDQRAVEVLEQKFPGLDIIKQDVLKIDWGPVLKTEKDIHLIGNLPYNITSQILFSVMDIRKYLSSVTVMMQKEVADRIIAEPGNKQYGILSVQLQLFSNPKILFDVSPNVFIPKPKVDSSVVQFTFGKEELACSDINLKKVVRTAFNQRRKKLSNALKTLGIDLPVDEFNFDLRAEAWEPEMYAKLTARLEQLDILN